MAGGAIVHRLDAAQGTSTWSKRLNATTWGAVSLANDLLFVPNNTVLYVMNAKTGDVLTEFETGGTIGGGAAAIVDGRVVVKSGMAWTDPSCQPNDQVICYALPADSGVNPAAGAGGAGGAASPAQNATFSAVYDGVILNGGCNSGQCHSLAAAGALDMMAKAVAYANLVGIAAMGSRSFGEDVGVARTDDLLSDAVVIDSCTVWAIRITADHSMGRPARIFGPTGTRKRE